MKEYFDSKNINRFLLNFLMPETPFKKTTKKEKSVHFKMKLSLF